MPRPTKPVPTPSTDDQPADGTQTDLVAAAIDVFNPDFGALNLHQKIARITGMIGGVEKRGYNAFHKYHYVMEGDLVAAVRQYLAAAGIVIIPDTVEHARDGELTYLMVRYTVTDGNESFSFAIPGYGADRGDKGVYKALTGSQKYALMKLFKIETGDDPEGDTRVDERTATAERPARATVVRSGDRAGVQRGAHTDLSSPVQLRRIAALQQDLDLDRPGLVALIAEVSGDDPVTLPDDDAEAGRAVLQVLKGLPSTQAGALIAVLEQKVIAAKPAEETSEGELAYDNSDPYG